MPTNTSEQGTHLNLELGKLLRQCFSAGGQRIDSVIDSHLPLLDI